jgi:hypothetical protein
MTSKRGSGSVAVCECSTDDQLVARSRSWIRSTGETPAIREGVRAWSADGGPASRSADGQSADGSGLVTTFSTLPQGRPCGRPPAAAVLGRQHRYDAGPSAALAQSPAGHRPSGLSIGRAGRAVGRGEPPHRGRRRRAFGRSRAPGSSPCAERRTAARQSPGSSGSWAAAAAGAARRR